MYVHTVFRVLRTDIRVARGIRVSRSYRCGGKNPLKRAPTSSFEAGFAFTNQSLITVFVARPQWKCNTTYRPNPIHSRVVTSPTSEFACLLAWTCSPSSSRFVREIIRGMHRLSFYWPFVGIPLHGHRRNFLRKESTRSFTFFCDSDGCCSFVSFKRKKTDLQREKRKGKGIERC